MARLPPKPTYISDGTGRDTYIRRDPQEQYGKQLYKSEVPRITRFGTAGETLKSDRHTGHAGFRPGKHEDVGGHGSISERPARFLKPPPDAFPMHFSKYFTTKEVTLDAYARPPIDPSRSNLQTHISGYSGFIPRGPMATDPDGFSWQGPPIDREELFRRIFLELGYPFGQSLTKPELARLCEVSSSIHHLGFQI